MNIGMIIPGMEVGCSIGIRLWMNHLGFVFFTLGGLAPPPQTGECFLLTFDLGRQDVNNKNNHGIGQINHGSTTEWINHGAKPQKLQTTSWNVLLRLVAGLRHC